MKRFAETVKKENRQSKKRIKIVMVKIFYLDIFLFVSIIKAQSFVATVDNNKVAENDRLELRFTFEGKNLNALKNFNPPSLKEFRVLPSKNQSTTCK
ncbi:MAG: hypothetical protein IPH89_15855 [Bacteroidetes bacterium]|nr:hypothetical protein [Bacteroidota bacterium]